MKNPDLPTVFGGARTDLFIGDAWADQTKREVPRTREPCPVCGHPTGDCR